MKKLLIVLFAGLLYLGYTVLPSEGADNDTAVADTGKKEAAVSTESSPAAEAPKPAVDIKIIDHRIKWTENREALIKKYAKMHYGMDDMLHITPQAVIVHWTVTENAESVLNYFYGETMPDDGGGTLNVASHFVVDRDGTIYRLTDEDVLNRHAIGYNWCAIGIENVGGVDGRENLTKEQLEANIALIKYLQAKYASIKYVWGHYQQDQATASGLFIEKVPDYYAGKIDPGKIFMTGLKNALQDSGLIFYEP